MLTVKKLATGVDEKNPKKVGSGEFDRRS